VLATSTYPGTSGGGAHPGRHRGQAWESIHLPGRHHQGIRVGEALCHRKERFGPLELLVTDAGLDDFMPLQQTVEQHYHSHYDVNALGVNLVVKETVKYINKKHGCILNISSLSSTHRHESDLV
jgi:hypothetical protein